MKVPWKWLSAGLLVVAPALGAFAAQDAPASAAVDINDCRTCHEEGLVQFDKTYHAGLENSCVQCHEGAAEHLAGRMEGEETPGPSFENLDASEANAVCLNCHEKGRQAVWDGGTHDRRGVSCISCHSVHKPQSAKAQLKTFAEADTCYTCHKDIRARAMRTSHHPVREGLMGCASCHDPHDSTRPKMIKADWTNDLCLTCHTEKRGPFLWEHAPVRENCLNCHNPHGSNHDKLLVAGMPYLCQRCHLNTRHPGTLYGAHNSATVTASASNRAVEHACKNCHQSIHGSNAPSGPYLGR